MLLQLFSFLQVSPLAFAVVAAALRGFFPFARSFSSSPDRCWGIRSVLKWSLNTAPQCTARHDTQDSRGKKTHHPSWKLKARKAAAPSSRPSLTLSLPLSSRPLFSSPTLPVHPFLTPILPSLLFPCVSSFLPPSITLSLCPFSPALIPFSYHRLLLPTLLLSDF